MRAKSRELDKLLDDECFQLATDPDARARRPRVSPRCRTSISPSLDNAVARLEQSAQAFDKEYARLSASERCTSRARTRTRQCLADQSRADADGCARLAGARLVPAHDLCAGPHTGYGVKTLPGIREAIEERRWDEANQYIGVVSRALNAYSARMDRAIAAPQTAAYIARVRDNFKE